jgi:predicted Zn-dependent peptidase
MKKYFFLVTFILEFFTVMSAYSIENIEINGHKIEYIFDQSNNIPVVSIRLVFKNSGKLNNSKYREQLQIDELPSITSMILNEGTKKLGAVGFAELLDEKSIRISSGVGKETFVIYIDTLKENLDFAIESFLTLMKDPNITVDSLKNVLTRKLGSLSGLKTNYDFLASSSLNNLIFKNTNLESADLETKIENIEKNLESEENIKHLIESVKVFIRENLNIQKVLLAVGGDISFDENKKYLTKILNSLPNCDKKIDQNKINNFDLITASDSQVNKTIVKSDTKQAYVYFASPFDISQKELNIDSEVKIKVLSFVLGASGFGSRMMDEIRTKHGLAYSVSAYISNNKSHIYLSGHLQTKNESKQKAIELVRKIIADFVKNGVTKNELESAKKFILGSEPLRNETLEQKINNSFQNHYRNRTPKYPKEFLHKIESLELKDLNNFISQHSELNKLSFSVVSNKK